VAVIAVLGLILDSVFGRCVIARAHVRGLLVLEVTVGGDDVVVHGDLLA
jgi:hypothetical protein